MSMDSSSLTHLLDISWDTNPVDFVELFLFDLYWSFVTLCFEKIGVKSSGRGTFILNECLVGHVFRRTNKGYQAYLLYVFQERSLLLAVMTLWWYIQARFRVHFVSKIWLAGLLQFSSRER